MTSLKWTGKGLQFTNRMVSPEVFEDWLEGEGEDYLEAKLEEGELGWFRKKAKAKKEVFDYLRSSISGETVKLALLSKLLHLPQIIEKIAREVKDTAKSLAYEEEMTWVVAVPRYSVRKTYRKYAVSELKNADELARFPEFAQLYLKSLANDSEKSFFDRIKKNKRVTGEHGIILGGDPFYDWRLDTDYGHYYYSRTSMATDLSKRSERNKLIKEASAMLEGFQVKLGLFTSDEKDKIAETLR